MWKDLLILLLSLFVLLPARSQERDHAMRRNIALGISDGCIDSTRKSYLNVGLFGNIDNLHGVQLDVLTSTVHHNAEGFNNGFLVSLVGKNVCGLQMAGIANVVGGDIRGLQFCSLANVSRTLHGVQISGFSNVTGDRFSGLQLCGIANIAIRVNRGVQLAGAMNVCASRTRGWQLAAYNYADTLDGSQFGFINACVHHQHGVQIGVINYSRDTVSHKVGLVNVNPNTRIQMMVYGGSATKINLAARFRNRSTYNIIGFGTHYMGLDSHFSGAVFYRIGQYFNLSPQWSVSSDLGYYHIETFAENSSASPDRLFSLQGRVNVDYRMTHALSLFASAGFGNTRYYNHARLYRSRMLLELGLTLF